MSGRSRSIRTKLVYLLLVPMASLLALWLFSARVTLGDTLILLDGRTLGNYAFSGEELLVALQNERAASLRYVGADRPSKQDELAELREQTDQALSAYRTYAARADVRRAAKPETKRWTAEALRRLETLDNVRRAVDARRVGVVSSLQAYGDVMMPLARIPGSMSDGVGVPQIAKEANTLGAMLVAREMLDREYAMMSGALADGELSTAEYTTFVEMVGAARYVYGQVVPDMRPEDQERYRQITTSPEYSTVRSLEDRVIAYGGSAPEAPIEVDEWDRATSAVMAELTAMGKASGQGTIDRTMPIILGILARLVLAGVLGLVAVVLSVVLSVRIGRSIISELTGLRRAAQELATDRLPRAVDRLRRGDPAEKVEAESALELPEFGTEEVAQVGEAFTAVQRTALNEAVNEAKTRAGIRQLFVNIARRNQTLLNRQLKMLDQMQRRTEDPDVLEDLFRLDHLSTRMQRHAEGLIILSGNAPGRTWRQPVPLVDVIRAALAEVEGYDRVDVIPMGPRDALLTGPAVASVVHLLAELIENASVYSPPHTDVRVFGELVANGYVVEIEDRGLGMSADALAAANERLVEPPEFDLAESSRLGLFIVGRLAARHQISVSLRESPYGGTTAIVLLPRHLIVTGADSAAERAGDHTQPDAAGRGAGASDGASAGTPVEPAAVSVGDNGLPRRVRPSTGQPPGRSEDGKE